MAALRASGGHRPVVRRAPGGGHPPFCPSVGDGSGLPSPEWPSPWSSRWNPAWPGSLRGRGVWPSLRAF